MSLKKSIISKKGEEIAKSFLIKNDYKILKTNYRCRDGEIDIIALDKNILVFFEIKTRSNLLFGPIINQISEKKANTIYNVAEDFIINHVKCEMDCRIDIICIFMDGNDVKSIEHFKNVYLKY